MEERMKKYYTVVKGMNEVYFVRCNNCDNDEIYFIIARSLYNKDLFLMRKVSKLDFETFRKFKSISVYDTDIIDFLDGKKLKEV